MSKFCFITFLLMTTAAFGQDTTLFVVSVPDFELNGRGDHPTWNQTEWINLPLRHGPSRELTSQAKVLYSETGIYFLMQCADEVLTATLTEDFADSLQGRRGRSIFVDG